ncbi:hypothetical protein F2Q69_00045129 [Brassica cretica]|uniref:Uncharacterized protein n=1 Tax=Brassica cretica TaxID=69181 RepID=A0A8S9NFA7_BRACR|nr:hypothetical protein F2Q69_00045129 [Brassica cretica]
MSCLCLGLCKAELSLLRALSHELSLLRALSHELSLSSSLFSELFSEIIVCVKPLLLSSHSLETLSSSLSQGLCKAVAPLKSLSRDPLKLTLSRSQALSSSNPLQAQTLSSSNPLKLKISLVRYSSQAHTLQLSFFSNASPALSLALSSQAHSLPLFLSLVKMTKDVSIELE